MAFAHVQTKPTKESVKICKNIKIETNLRLLSFHDVACLHHVGPFGKIVKIWNSGLPGRSSSKISWANGGQQTPAFSWPFLLPLFWSQDVLMNSAQVLQPTPRRDLRPPKLQPESRPLTPGECRKPYSFTWYLWYHRGPHQHPNKRTREIERKR